MENVGAQKDVYCQIGFLYKTGGDTYCYPTTLDGEPYLYNLTAALKATMNSTQIRVESLIGENTVDDLIRGGVEFDELSDSVQSLIMQFMYHARELINTGNPEMSKQLSKNDYIVTFQHEDGFEPRTLH